VTPEVCQLRVNVNPFEHRTLTRTRTFSYTEDGLKESWNVCKYR